jgi:hypothetical protein
MVAIIPQIEVAKATEELPLRYGIFQAAIGPLNFPDVHARGGGLWWQEAMCGGGSLYEINCIDALDTKVFDPDGTNIVVGLPFVVKSDYTCMLTNLEEAERLARQKFFSVEQSQVEQAFSQGLVAQAPSLSNNPDVVDLSLTSGATEPVDVISVLENAIYCTSQYGPRAVLHMPIAVFNRLKSEHLIEFDGLRWRTPTGTVVSSGCYAGFDPTGIAAGEGTFWVYITGQTVVYRTAVDDVEQIPVQGSLNRTTNQYTGLVEREYVVAFECGVYAMPVTLWTP